MLRLRDMTPLRGVTTELDHPQRCGNGRKNPPPYPDALCDLLCCCENKFVMRDFELEWSKQLFANSKKSILNFTYNYYIYITFYQHRYTIFSMYSKINLFFNQNTEQKPNTLPLTNKYIRSDQIPRNMIIT